MKFKRFTALVICLAMIASVMMLQPVASAALTGVEQDPYTESTDRADMTYKYLGTSSSISGVDLSTLDDSKLVWKKNDYIWVAVTLSKLTRIADMFGGNALGENELVGLTSIQADYIYDNRYLEPVSAVDAAANGVFDTFKATYPTSGTYGITDADTGVFDTNEYYDGNNSHGNPEYAYSWDWFPTVLIDRSNFADAVIGERDKTNISDLSITVGETAKVPTNPRLFDGTKSTVTDSEYLMIAYPIKMISETAPATGVTVLQGYPNETTVVTAGGGEDTQGYTYYAAVMGAEAAPNDLGLYVNIKGANNVLPEPEKTYTVTFDTQTDGKFSSDSPNTTHTRTISKSSDGKFYLDYSDYQTETSDVTATTAGYSFSYWSTDTAGNDRFEFTPAEISAGKKEITNNVDLYANYELSYDLTVHADTNSNFSGTPGDTKVYGITDPYQVTSTTLSTIESDLNVDTGYEIEGFYKEASFTTKLDSTNLPWTLGANSDIYVKTQPIQYKVKFQISSGASSNGLAWSAGNSDYTVTLTASTTDGKVYLDNSTVTAATAKLDTIPAHYSFSGWFTDDGCTTSKSAGSVINASELDSNRTLQLYAGILEDDKYLISFEASDADPAYTTQSFTVHKNSSIESELSKTIEATFSGGTPPATFDVPNPQKTGYTFVEWKADDGTVYTDNYTVTKAMTFKAQWKQADVDVTFKDTKTTSPFTDTVYSVYATKTIATAGAAKIKGTSTAVTDVPADPTAPTSYEFYGWYTISPTSTLSLNDIKAKTKKSELNAIVTSGDIVKFDKDTTIGSSAVTVYALYALSQSSVIEPPSGPTDKTGGAKFLEDNASGRAIPFVQNDYLPVVDPKTPVAGVTYAPTGTEVTFTPSATTYYMVVSNDVADAYTEITTDVEGATLTINKVTKDSGGNDVKTPVSVSTTGAVNTATLPLDVTKDKSANKFEVTIVAPDNSTNASTGEYLYKTVYTFNILRYAVPAVTAAYGNSPAGLIRRDTEHGWTDAEKDTMINNFKTKNGNNKNYDSDKVPILSGSVIAGTEVYAPYNKKKPYTSNAWISYGKVNYDADDKSYFVYQGSKFKDPGYTYVNEFGEESTTGATVSFPTPLHQQKKDGVPDYTAANLTTMYQDFTPTLSGGKYSLTGKRIRPDVYSMKYDMTITSVYGNSVDLSDERPFIIVNKSGDVYLSILVSTNSSDAKVIFNNTTKVNKGNSLIAFRSADIEYSILPSVNSSDAKTIFNRTTYVNKNPYTYYPTLD